MRGIFLAALLVGCGGPDTGALFGAMAAGAPSDSDAGAARHPSGTDGAAAGGSGGTPLHRIGAGGHVAAGAGGSAGGAGGIRIIVTGWVDAGAGGAEPGAGGAPGAGGRGAVGGAGSGGSVGAGGATGAGGSDAPPNGGVCDAAMCAGDPIPGGARHACSYSRTGNGPWVPTCGYVCGSTGCHVDAGAPCVGDQGNILATATSCPKPTDPHKVAACLNWKCIEVCAPGYVCP